jgi:hypothetical protein
LILAKNKYNKITGMRKSLLLLSLALLIGCEKNDNESGSHYLKNCNVEFLNFSRDYRFQGRELYILPNDTSETLVSYEYKGEKAVKVIGGFKIVPSGSNFSRGIFSADIHDSIVYDGDTVKVFERRNTIYQPAPTLYIYNAQHKLVKLVCSNGWQEINYSYSDSQIIESGKTGNVLRTMYFEKNNLFKITETQFDDYGIIRHKEEIFFEDYDSNPNPFKNKFHLFGGYYRAFSENNYSKITITDYSYNGDSLILTGSYWYSMPIQYDKSGYPLFGEY